MGLGCLGCLRLAVEAASAPHNLCRFIRGHFCLASGNAHVAFSTTQESSTRSALAPSSALTPHTRISDAWLPPFPGRHFLTHTHIHTCARTGTHIHTHTCTLTHTSTRTRTRSFITPSTLRPVPQARKLLRDLPSLVDIDVPSDSHITVCGDVHGQVSAVQFSTQVHGWLSASQLVDVARRMHVTR